MSEEQIEPIVETPNETPVPICNLSKENLQDIIAGVIEGLVNRQEKE